IRSTDLDAVHGHLGVSLDIETEARNGERCSLHTDGRQAAPQERDGDRPGTRLHRDADLETSIRSSLVFGRNRAATRIRCPRTRAADTERRDSGAIDANLELLR